MTARSATTTRPPPTLRRRFDNLSLRWQARLDAAWADRFLPWSLVIVVSLSFGLLAYARFHAVETGPVLARYVQAAWLIAHGQPAGLTLTGNHLLADRFPLAFYPIAQLTRWIPAAPLLLGLQSFSLGLGVVPLWHLARRVAELRVGTTGVLVGVYALHPLVNLLNLAEFQPIAVAVAPVLAATLFGLRGRWRPYAAAVVLTLAWDADLGMVVVGLGLLLIVEGCLRPGLRSVALGLGWTAFALYVIEPQFGDAVFVAPRAFADYGRTSLDVVITMVANPFRVVGDIVAAPNMAATVGALAPVLFLPILAPRYLLPAAPLQLLYFVAAVPVAGERGAGFTVPLLLYTLVAAAFALNRIGRRAVARVLVDARVLGVLIVAAVGIFLVAAPTSPYTRPWQWAQRDQVDEARVTAADLVGAEHAVRASSTVLGLLAERQTLYELRSGQAPTAKAAADGVDTVILDDSVYPDWPLDDRTAFERGMMRRGFALVYRAQGITVYERGGL